MKDFIAVFTENESAMPEIGGIVFQEFSMEDTSKVDETTYKLFSNFHEKTTELICNMLFEHFDGEITVPAIKYVVNFLYHFRSAQKRRSIEFEVLVARDGEEPMYSDMVTMTIFPKYALG